MSLYSAVGRSQTHNGKDAGAEAAREALNFLGRVPVLLAWVIVDEDFPMAQVIAGVNSVVEAPCLAFTTSGELNHLGESRRSVVVALLGGNGVDVKAEYWPGFGEDSRVCAQKMTQSLQPAAYEGSLMFIMGDGFNGDAETLCAIFPRGKYTVAGGLAGGSIYKRKAYMAGGRQSGAGGIAAARLSGRLQVGVGYAHGWEPTGAFARITRVQGMWVRELEGEHPNIAYERWFGNPAHEWSIPPLHDLIRLYPFGIDQEGELQVRSPLCMEADGSLRMNSVLPEGKNAYLMVGSMDSCRNAARFATQQALKELRNARPVLAIILVDAAWQKLFGMNSGALIEPIREMLGSEVTLAGGYTFGQLVRRQPAGKGTQPLASTTHFLNQHIEVVIIGDPQSP